MKTKLTHPFLAAIIKAVLWALVGLGAGLLNGLLGASGGILLVYALPRLPSSELLSSGHLPPHPMDRRDIMATALCVMLPTSAVSFLLYWLRGIRPDISMLAALILPAALGGLLGAFLMNKISGTTLKKCFALLVVLSGIRMLL